MTPVNPLDLWLRTGSKHHPQPEQYIFLDVFTNYRLVRFPEGRTASLLSQENYVLWSPLSLSLSRSLVSPYVNAVIAFHIHELPVIHNLRPFSLMKTTIVL